MGGFSQRGTSVLGPGGSLKEGAKDGILAKAQFRKKKSEETVIKNLSTGEGRGGGRVP